MEHFDAIDLNAYAESMEVGDVKVVYLDGTEEDFVEGGTNKCADGQTAFSKSLEAASENAITFDDKYMNALVITKGVVKEIDDGQNGDRRIIEIPEPVFFLSPSATRANAWPGICVITTKEQVVDAGIDIGSTVVVKSWFANELTDALRFEYTVLGAPTEVLVVK